jgi:hypothetical protein
MHITGTNRLCWGLEKTALRRWTFGTPFDDSPTTATENYRIAANVNYGVYHQRRLPKERSGSQLSMYTPD